MNLSSLKAGDIIEVDKKGRRFHALVRLQSLDLTEGTLPIRPLNPRETYTTATAREIVGIWHANKPTRTRRQA